MKMSDYFGELSLCGDCIEDDSFHYATTSCEYVVNGVDAGQAICHAVNNYDRLVELLEYFYKQPVDLSQVWPAGHIAKQNEAVSLLKELGHEI